MHATVRVHQIRSPTRIKMDFYLITPENSKKILLSQPTQVKK